MSQENLIEKKPEVPFKEGGLKPEEIEKAKLLIGESHELVDTPLWKVFPALKLFGMGKPKVGDAGSEQPLIDEEKSHHHKDDHHSKKQKMAFKEGDVEPDTLNQYGFGMIAYKDLMITLSGLFAILTILMIPALSFYSSGTGIGSYKTFSQYSLGNFGYSTSKCLVSPFDLGSVPIKCQYGKLTKVISAGVMPGTLKTKNICNDKVTYEGTQCPVKSDLSASILSQYKSGKVEEGANGLFLFRFTADELFGYANTVAADCKSSEARVFVTYTCEQDEETLTNKYQMTSVVSCLSVLLVLIYMTVLHYFKRNSDLNQLKWDMLSVTPGDYTMQLEITQSMYNLFKNHKMDKKSKKPEIQLFKEYLKEQIENILNQKLDMMKAEAKEKKEEKTRSQIATAINDEEEQHHSHHEGHDINIESVRIADIVFAFDNSVMIKDLKARGLHLMFNRYIKAKEVEDKMIKCKEENFESLIRPVDAFITFEEEDGKIVAGELEAEFTFFGKKKPAEFQLLDEDLHFIEATEPTNIIWENRHFTAADYLKRTFQVLAIIGCLLAVSFMTIYYFKSGAIAQARKYPPVKGVDIMRLYQTPADNMTDNSKMFLLYEHAKQEYNYLITAEAEGSRPILNGFYQTFCIAFVKTPERFSTVKDLSYDICEKYNGDLEGVLINDQIVKFSIIAINYVLRLFIIKLIMYIGKDTESEQTRLITNGVFVVQFFNTALLLLMVNANLQEQGAPLSWLSAETGIPDFNSQWFNDIGVTLTGAMLFNVYWPIIEFFVFGAMRQTYRLLDNGFSRNTMKSKKTTLQQYIELYSGPIFFIHYKYSAILNIVFVTMMYGMGLPILFPIASMSLLTLYCMEKLMLHYAYREPPMYDEKLNKNALSILTWAPCLFLSFGYWMLSNKQLLSNSLPHTWMRQDDTNIKSGHEWTEVFASETYSWGNPAMPLLVTFWVILFLCVFRNTILKLWNLVPILSIADFEIDEGLPNYFLTIDDEDRNWSLTEEKYSKHCLGVQVLDPYTVKQFEETTIGEKHMKGTHCYDILANEVYKKEFQYYSPAIGDGRCDFIRDGDDDEGNDEKQSDFVKMILSIPFMSKEHAHKFKADDSIYINAPSTFPK